MLKISFNKHSSEIPFELLTTQLNINIKIAKFLALVIYNSFYCK